MRNCCTVITQIVELIPNDKLEFLQKLAEDYEDASYKSPEETIQWERTSLTLQKYIDDPKEEWEFKVLSIFSTLPIEEIKVSALEYRINKKQV